MTEEVRYIGDNTQSKSTCIQNVFIINLIEGTSKSNDTGVRMS